MFDYFGNQLDPSRFYAKTGKYFIDIALTALQVLIGTRDYVPFLNSRNELYRERNMAEKTPSREQAISLMSKNPNLIKRPIAMRGEEMVLGFDVTAYMSLVK